jgi:hypothetical protein
MNDPAETKMTKTGATEELTNAERCQRELFAIALDEEIRHEIELMQTSLSKVAEMLLKMREERLWTYLVNPTTKVPYRRFDEYVSSVTGDEIAHTKLYDLLAISRLSVGPNAIPPETVQKLGRIKSAEIARLEPQERTPELVQELLDRSVAVVKQRVQEIINISLPPDERRDVPLFWGRYYPRQVIERFEQLEARGCFLEGIRDGDRTITLRAKFMVALIINFEANFEEELKEADAYIAAMQAKKSALGAETFHDQEHDDPPEPEEFEASLDARDPSCHYPA